MCFLSPRINKKLVYIYSPRKGHPSLLIRSHATGLYFLISSCHSPNRKRPLNYQQYILDIQLGARPNWLVFKRFRKTAKSDYYLRHFSLSVRSSVRLTVSPHGTNQRPLEDFHENRCLRIFRKSVGKVGFPLKSEENKGNLHEDQHIFFNNISLNSS